MSREVIEITRPKHVWTIQPIEVWKTLQANKLAWVDPQKVSPHYPNLPIPYVWLAQELSERHVGFSGRLPWWTYTSKPDLRKHRHLDRTTTQVRLELVVDENFCFFSRPAWEAVLTGNYLGTPLEVAEFEKKLRVNGLDETWPLPGQFHARLISSWNGLFESIFDGELLGVVESLHLKSVVEVTFFEPRNREPPRKVELS